MYKLLDEQTSLWQRLKVAKKPIYIYGMGDGAEKIIAVLGRLGIPVAGIYASNSFVRGHSFNGCKVLRFDEVKEQTPDFISLLAFAAFREPMLEVLYAMQKECEFYAPDVPVCKVDDTLFDIDYIMAHNDELTLVYNMLADAWSRRVFVGTLNFKVSGKVDYLKAITSPISEVYTNIIKPMPQDTYVDLGAYNGDTVAEVLTYTGGEIARIVAFEPDLKNFTRLNKRIENERIQNITAYNIGAWNEEETLHFAGKGGRNAKIDTSGTREVHANSVDNVLGGSKAGIIKFDVEGAELLALEGCKKTIMTHKPRLMVSAYHKNEDLFALPLYIKSLNQGYKIYLRHHPYIPSWETNFYAV